MMSGSMLPQQTKGELSNLYERKISFYKNAIKICENAKDFANKVSEIFAGDEFQEKITELRNQGMSVDKNNRQIQLLTAKATAQICASYALMLVAAAAFVVAVGVLCLNFGVIVGAGIIIPELAAAQLVAGAAFCLSVEGVGKMKDYSENNYRSAEHANASSNNYANAINSFQNEITLIASEDVKNSLASENVIKEVRKIAEKVVEAAKEIEQITEAKRR
ncbi:MAG: hypothetical protein LW825_02645 [Candidatus Jidaibacter sp.]|nr:hypothetical protein [Candidatus Jidaibacter sp.]